MSARGASGASREVRGPEAMSPGRIGGEPVCVASAVVSLHVPHAVEGRHASRAGRRGDDRDDGAAAARRM